MKVALVRLPYESIVPIDGFHNLHGIWNPPKYVLNFWASGASIEYLGEDDFERKKLEILESYETTAKRSNRWKQL